jgi:hypothetical protein
MSVPILSALVLTASCASRSVEPIPILPPPSLTAPCAPPVSLPEGAMTQAEVEKAWGRDRSALRTCAERHQALASWPQLG